MVVDQLAVDEGVDAVRGYGFDFGLHFCLTKRAQIEGNKGEGN